jgi:hypothetical protein
MYLLQVASHSRVVGVVSFVLMLISVMGTPYYLASAAPLSDFGH